MKLSDFRKTDIGNFFFCYIESESNFLVEQEKTKKCQKLYETISEKEISFDEIKNVLSNLYNNDIIQKNFKDKKIPTTKEIATIRYVYVALLMEKISKNKNEIFEFFNNGSFKYLIEETKKQKLNKETYAYSRYFTDEVSINEIFLYNIIKNNKNVIFTDIKLENVSETFICNILSDSSISKEYKKWAISTLNKNNIKNILDSYINSDIQQREKININDSVNFYTFNSLISYDKKPTYGIKNKDYKKCADFLFDKNKELIQSYPVIYKQWLEIKNSESFIYFLHRTKLDIRTNKEKIIKNINNCEQQYLINMINQNYKYLMEELFRIGNEWVLPYLNKKTEGLLKKLPNEFKFECIKNIIEGNSSYFNKSYNSHNVNMFMKEFDFKENKEDSVFVDFKLVLQDLMRGNDLKILKKLLSNNRIKKEDIANEILKVTQKRYSSTLSNNSDIFTYILKQTNKDFWYNVIKNSNIENKNDCTKSNVYDFLFIYLLNNNKVFEYIELLPYISKIDDKISKVIKDKIFEGMIKITNKKNVEPLLILKKYGIVYDQEDLLSVLENSSPAITPSFLLNEVYYSKNKKIDYPVYINGLLGLYHNISYGNNLYKVEGFINSLNIERHEYIDMLQKFNADYRKDNAAYEKRKMKEKVIKSILTDYLNIQFNEKTLFQKDNLEIIIFNLESEQIYDKFSNLKKKTKKRI